MDNLNGFIKIHRKLLTWEWYTDINVRVLFFHCLLKANHKSERWQGIEIKAGQFVTSYGHLAKECGLSTQQTRTAIDKLKLTGEITSQTTSRYSIITIRNWYLYQTNNKQNNKQITNEQQTNNNKQEIKEEKKNINLSLSNSSTRARVGKREREILKSYCKNPKNGVKNPDGFIATILKNGDYKTILEEEKKRLERKQGQTVTSKSEVFVPDLTQEQSTEIFEQVRKKLRRARNG